MAAATFVIQIDGIDIEVTRKRVRRMNLRVGRDGSVRASVPKTASQASVEAFLQSKASWMRRAIERFEGSPIAESRTWTTGERVSVWGRELKLVVVPIEGWKRPRASIEGEALHMTLSPQDATPERADARRSAYLDLLKRELLGALPSIALRCEAIVGESASSWSVRHMRTRWGSCTPTTRRIRLNSELAAFEPLCADYVAIHELCHLIVPNHGDRFHELMDGFFPGWEEMRSRLRHIPGAGA